MAHVISLVELFGSQGLLQNRCMEWRQGSVMSRMESVQPARMLAVTVACSLGSVDVNSGSINACGAPVQDATAPPPVRRDCYKRAPRTVALKTRRVRKRSASGGGGGGSGDEEGRGEEGFEGSGCDGSSGGGSWGGGENGRGGWDQWGESWNEHEGRRRWEQLGSHAAVGLLYQAACWISFSRCMYYAFQKVVGLGSLPGSKGASEATSFAYFSSSFLHKKPLHLNLPAATKCVC